ncbi:ribonuclease D [soil metagenome]
MPLEEYRLVDTAQGLTAALAWLDDLDPVGIDVERADWNRYYRAAALIQVGGDGRVALVDPMALQDLAPLHDFCAGRVVVLHALENDVGPMQSVGVDPTVIHDTAIAAAILGMPMGLETLLHEVLDVTLASDKAAMQRADWEKRPMTDEMLSYAAGDVADLPRLWGILEAKLHEADRWDWYVEEVAAIISQPNVEQRRDWQRTKGVGRLDPMARARAKALWEAREDLARDTDTAPGRIVNDKVLVDLALTPPGNLRELGRRGVRRQAVKTFGEDIVQALQTTATPVPVERAGRRSTDADRELSDLLRARRSEIAEEVGLDAGMLCPSRHLLKAVMSDPQSPEELREALGLRDWQWNLLAEAFIDALFEPLDEMGADDTEADDTEADDVEAGA